MTMIKWLCTFLMLGSTFAWAESSDAELLEKYREIYKKTTGAYETEFRRAVQIWPIDYIKALQALQTKLQTSGDLDGWEVVNKELTRFRGDPTLNETTASLVDVRALQDRYRAHAKQLKSERDAKIEDLRNKYVSRLAALQREWTQQGKFDSAFAARDEIERAGGAPTAAPAKIEEAQAVAGDRPPEIPQSKPASPTDVVTHSDGTEVSPPGAPAPSKEGLLFKRKLLSTTEHSPWPSSVSVKLWETSDKDSSSFERDKFVGTMDGKVKSDMRYLRVALRAMKADGEMRNLRLQVEYYAKPASGSGEPRRVARKTIPIPLLDTRLVYVDMAPVSIDSLSRSLSVGAFREYTRTVGDKFYGYIVTMLDADKTVLYQGASSATLAKLAQKPTGEQGQVDKRKPFAGKPIQGLQGRPKRLRKIWE